MNVARFLLAIALVWSQSIVDAHGLEYVKAKKRYNILFCTVDAGGHFASYTGLWDGLARRGHHVTVGFPAEIQRWFDDARALYENTELENLQTLHMGEALVQGWLESDVVKNMDKVNPFTLIRKTVALMEAGMKSQISSLSEFLQHNDVDVIVHDMVGLSALVMCKIHNKPCVTLNVLTNIDQGTMSFWRPALGMGLSPDQPSFLERLAMPIVSKASTLVTGLALSASFYSQNTQLAWDFMSGMLTSCFPAAIALITVTPGLDQAQIVSPSTVFVGPMRDLTRYVSLPTPEQHFLDKAHGDGIPVFFLAAGVTAVISDEHVHHRLAVIQELVKDGSIRVMWANKRGLNDHSIDKEKLLVSTWIPQEAALRHPAVKVFGFHGGSTSMMEGVAAGVPFLCSPYAFEQVNNCVALQRRNMGVFVPSKATVETYVYGVRRVLADHLNYAEHVYKAWNRVIAFGEGEDAYGARRAVRWVESVAESGGEHLRPEICNWATYQQFHLDILLAFATLLSLLLILALRINRWHRNRSDRRPLRNSRAKQD